MCLNDEKPFSFAMGIKCAKLDDDEVTCDFSLYAKLEDVATVGGTSEQIYLVSHLGWTKRAEHAY